MFTLSSSTYSYAFAHAPQTFKYSPQPRASVTQTVGGQVVQLLGFSIDMEFTGILSSAGRTRAEMAQEAELFSVFFSQAMENQKSGIPAKLVWTDRNLRLSVFIKQLSFNQALDTVVYPYSFSCTAVRIGTLSSSDSYNQLWSKLKNQIGFIDPGGGWHGGQPVTSLTQLKLSAITGFPGFASASSSGAGGGAGSSSSAGSVQGSANMSPSQAQAYAKSQLEKYGLNPADFQDLVQLWDRESGWNMHAENASSGAYGIPQADPDGGQGVANQASYRNNAMTQIAWGLKYIKDRYGSLSAAWQHEVEDGWY